jgi:hypothetical protein
MQPFKACSCRDPETGRKLGKQCPDLDKKGHSKWYARYEAPPSADGRRRQPRIGPYGSETEAKRELAKVIAAMITAGYSAGRKVKVGPYLDQWHADRVSEDRTGAGLAASTLAAEEEAIRLYLKPGLGHITLAEMRAQQTRGLYGAMRKLNRAEEKDDSSEPISGFVPRRNAA